MGFLTTLAEGAATGGVSAALNLGVGALTQSMNNRNAKNMAKFNDNLQRRLILDSPQLQKSGLQRAGLSVAALNGQFNTVSSSQSADTPQITAPQADVATGMMNWLTAKNMQKQNESLDQDIYSKKLDNQVKKALIDETRSKTEETWYEYNGFRIPADEIEEFFKKNPDVKTSDVDIVKVGGKLSLDQVNIARDVAQSKAATSKARVEDEVNRLQLSDKKVLQSLSKMPAQTYDNLVRTGEILLKDKEIKDIAVTLNEKDVELKEIDIAIGKLQKKIAENDFNTSQNTDIRKVLNKIFEDGFEIQDIGKILAAILVGLLPSTSISYSRH